MQEVSLCPVSDIYILFLRPEVYSFTGQSIIYNISDICSFKLTTCSDLTGSLVFTDNRSVVSFSFDAKKSPFVVVSKSHIYIPSFKFSYSFDVLPLFDHRMITVTSTFPFFFKDLSLLNSSDKYISTFLSNGNNKFLSCSKGDVPPVMYLFAVVSNFSDILSELPSSSTVNNTINNKYPSASNSFSYQSSDSDDIDDDDDYLYPQTLSHFLDQNTVLMNLPIVLPSFPEARPRFLILIYCLKSFLSHVEILYRILFFNIRLLTPYLRSISQYLHGRNRYPLLTFLMPLFTSISSVYFLSISGSAPFLVYGAIAYLVVSRMLKISYIASKVSRRVDTDVYPVLFLAHILPLFLLIFFLSLFSPFQFVLILILFYIYCQFFQYALKFSHFIGDVRMFYKLTPSVVFALFSLFGLNNPSLYLPLSFLSVIFIMILFPRLFRLQIV